MDLKRIIPVGWMGKQFQKIASGKLGSSVNGKKVILVTGSAGKTIVGHLLYHILNFNSRKVGFVGTNGIWLDGDHVDPEFVINVASVSEIAAAVSRLATSDAEIIVIEAPAINIQQGAFGGIEIDSLAITNIGGEDFSADFKSNQEYAESMFALLHQVVPEGLAVLNGDDDAANWISQSSHSIQQDIYADWVSKEMVTELSHSLNGIKFKFNGGFFETRGLSTLYLEDVLMAIKLASKYVGTDDIDKAINSYPGLAGREQVVRTSPVGVIVDYAYQPVIIDMLLTDLRESIKEAGRIITVVGAAGRRGDERKKVGIPVAKQSDIVLLACQDPRGESVSGINSRIADYAEPLGGVVVERITDMQEFQNIPKGNLEAKIDRVIKNSDVPIVTFDAESPGGRYNAIQLAVHLARPGDLVVILGKGDDKILDFDKTLYEWNDFSAAEDILRDSKKQDSMSKYLAPESSQEQEPDLQS